MNISDFQLIISIIAGAAVFAIVLGVTRRGGKTQTEVLDERLGAYGSMQTPLTLDQIELSRSFGERVVRPLLDKWGKRLSGMQPKGQSEKLQQQIDLAGRPYGLTASSFIVVQMALALFFGLAFTAVAVVLHMMPLLGLVFGAVLGYIVPGTRLKQTVKKRQKEITLALPGALDLLTISVEAGLGFDAALSRVVEKFDNALSQEFSFLLREIRLGRPRQEAMDDLGKRTGVSDLNGFVQAIIQSDELGVGIARVLRIQSEELRRKRRQRAEAKAQQASLKMLFPMVGCIFPTLFIILLGPAAIHLLLHVG